MDSRTHIAIATWAADHPALAGFLRMSAAEIAFFAVEPDRLFGDNLIGGDPDSRWYHSRKHDDAGNYVAGSVDSMLSSFGVEAHNARAVGDFERVRRLIALASHYAVDAGTPWHVAALRATHSDGEKALGSLVDGALSDLVRAPAVLTRPGSIGGSTRDFCRETWTLFVPRIRGMARGSDLAGMPELGEGMLRRCATFSLAVQLEIMARALGAVPGAGKRTVTTEVSDGRQ